MEKGERLLVPSSISWRIVEGKDFVRNLSAKKKKWRL